ncbi:response regulator [Hellea balneolensis]|uniref:response regulator n=1 Tax=Hellea balneolensis TaxID=287478 RepID=UPI00040F09F6|nr:response regulator [Hellea balneolensis]
MRRVLVIDDSEFDRRMITRAMKGVDESLSFAELDNGCKIIETMHHVKPDLVLLDIRMPGFGGFDVLDIIRADDEFQTCHVIMISGSSSDGDKRTASQKGASRYFTKPSSQVGYKQIAEDIKEQFLHYAA